MLLKDIEQQLLALSIEEKKAVIQLLSQNLISPWQSISKTPGVMGGEACIRNTRIPVWLLMSYRRLGLSEAKLLDNYPSLTATDLVNAWTYAEVFPGEIETASRQQDEA